MLTPAILDPGGTPDQLERFEGMRVHADSLTSVAPTNDFGEIATVLTGVPRPMREPGISVLGAGAARSDIRRARLLHPALRREPRADHRSTATAWSGRRC